MTRDELLAYCLAKPGAWEDQPWEEDSVAKVGSKIFAFLGSPGAGPGATVGLKCGASREVADEWLQRYPDDAKVMAYIGRSGWNSLRIGAAIPDEELLEAVDASYDTVVSKLPKKDRPAVP
jgi:predicted DNA-binding protein (MmcQ/YjbR family)